MSANFESGDYDFVLVLQETLFIEPKALEMVGHGV